MRVLRASLGGGQSVKDAVRENVGTQNEFLNQILHNFFDGEGACARSAKGAGRRRATAGQAGPGGAGRRAVGGGGGPAPSAPLAPPCVGTAADACATHGRRPPLQRPLGRSADSAGRAQQLLPLHTRLHFSGLLARTHARPVWPAVHCRRLGTVLLARRACNLHRRPPVPPLLTHRARARPTQTIRRIMTGIVVNPVFMGLAVGMVWAQARRSSVPTLAASPHLLERAPAVFGVGPRGCSHRAARAERACTARVFSTARVSRRPTAAPPSCSYAGASPSCCWHVPRSAPSLAKMRVPSKGRALRRDLGQRKDISV